MKISSKLRALGEKSKSELIEAQISVSTIRDFKILQENVGMSQAEGRNEAPMKHRIKTKGSSRKKRLKIAEREDDPSDSGESNDEAEDVSIDSDGDLLDYGSDASTGGESCR